MIAGMLPVFGRAQAVAGGTVSPGKATLRLPGVFGDKMVLQRGIPIPVWGWASADDRIVAKLGNAVVTTKANRDGKWIVYFPKRRAGGPYRLDITEEGRAGGRVKFSDILIGDVWVASGQSNMELRLNAADGYRGEKKVAAQMPIRQFLVRRAQRCGVGLPADGVSR